MDDAELLTRVLQRDAQAMDALMHRHSADVRAAIVRIVRDESAVDDLVQEVFLRVWTRAEQFAAAGSVRAWIGRIGTNLALNHLRSIRRRRTQPLEPPVDDGSADADAGLADDSEQDPHALLEAVEQRERLRWLMSQLPDEKREILDLVYDADLSLDQAAQQLGIPSGTAKSRLHYTMKRLGQQWKELENPED